MSTPRYGLAKFLAHLGESKVFPEYGANFPEGSSLRLSADQVDQLLLGPGCPLLTNELCPVFLARGISAPFQFLSSEQFKAVQSWLLDLSYALSLTGTRRTVKEWAFEYQDPLSSLAFNASAAVNPPLNTAYFPSNFST